MSLLRKQIRKRIISTLVGRTNARERVRANRGEVTWGENLPSISVYFKGESEITEIQTAPRKMRRHLELEVECIVSGQDGEEISDNMDDLTEQVERCLSVDDSVGGCANDIILAKDKGFVGLNSRTLLSF